MWKSLHLVLLITSGTGLYHLALNPTQRAPLKNLSQDSYQASPQDSPFRFLFDFGLYLWVLQNLPEKQEVFAYHSFIHVRNRVFAFQPRFPSLYLVLSHGLIYQHQRPHEAVFILRKALTLFPRNTEIPLTLSYVYRVLLKDPEKGKKYADLAFKRTTSL